MLRYILFLVGAFLIIDSSQAQNKQPDSRDFVFSSPSGNYISLKPEGGKSFTNNSLEIIIEKSVKGENKFSKLAVFSPVKSYDVFEKIAGANIASEFKNYIKAKSNEKVIEFLNTPHSPKEYGLFILNVNFLRALGFLYLDEMPQERTLQYEYRLLQDGKVIKQQTARAFNKNDLPKGHVKKLYTTDSLVSISWEFPGFKTNLPLFGKVYRQDDGKGKFFVSPTITTLNAEASKLTAFHEEQMTPEHLVSYYIVPVDFFGNEGMPSDTATAITVDFKKIPGVQYVTITDTLDGLLCQWKQLPAKPYYTGIQILRSRDANKDFIVLDSVSVNTTSYLDNQVLPNITYFYKFRPLVYKLSGWGEIIATSFHGTKGSSHNPPLSPKNLEAFKEERNIRLTWDHNQELDLYAYYVKRGTSSKNMEIVSPAVFDTTWLDTTTNLSGRINYVYSVIAMNNNQLKSDESGTAGIRPDRGGFVETPAGISIKPDGNKLSLVWPDVSRKDIAIVGYILYRKKMDDKEFLPVTKGLIERPYFEDVNVQSNTKYIYHVTAVDRFGYESPASPEAVFILSETVTPPSELFLRKLSAGVEVSWPKNEDERIISYNVYRRLPNENNYVKVGTAKPSDGLFIDKKYAPGKLNIYVITILIAGGESNKSIEKTLFVEK